MQPSPEKYIYEKPTGYQVSIEVGDLCLTKYFGITDYGSMESAHSSAIGWRNETLADPEMTQEKICPLALEVRKNPNTISATNESGIIGIQHIVNDRGVTHWVALWKDEDGYHQTRYSINEHGKENAFYYACMKRYSYCGVLMVTSGRKKWPADITEFLTCKI